MKQQKLKAKKLPKGVDETFLDAISSMNTDELKSVIVQLQIANRDNEEFKESPQFQEAQAEYDHAKDRYNLVAGPIRDVTVAVKNKTKLVIERLKEKGSA